MIYDPAAQHTLSVETHHMAIDYSAWEGMVVAGKADTVISRGEVIVENDQYVGRKGHGQFLKRGLSQYLT